MLAFPVVEGEKDYEQKTRSYNKAIWKWVS